jgi:hypothetical protein
MNTLASLGENWEIVLAAISIGLVAAGVRVRGRRNKPLRGPDP